MNNLDHDYRAFTEVPEPDEPIGTMFARVAQSGKDYARAELDRQKLRAGLYAAGARDAGIMFGVAAVLGLSAVIALLVGLIFTLSYPLGPLWATVVVVLGALIVAGIFALLGRARLRKMTEATKA